LYLKPASIFMSLYVQTSFLYPHDTVFSNISYDSHKKNCLTARTLSRKFSVKGKLNYITAILVHLLPVYLLHFHNLYPKGNLDKCRRVT